MVDPSPPAPPAPPPPPVPYAGASGSPRPPGFPCGDIGAADCGVTPVCLLPTPPEESF